jgi:hypothetical protein
MRKSLLAVAAVVAVVGGSAPLAHAALTANSNLTQSIGNGTLSTDIRDGSNAIVASPSFGMSAVNVSTSQQTTTGTFGTATQRISVDNPSGANNGFSITLNATDPTAGKWTSGANTYDFNDTVALGRLTVDPSVSTWTALVGTTTAITKGTSASFTGGTGAASAITLATASAALEDIWNGYMTGTTLTQTIPANQPAGTYTISMTQTVAAL